jgi:hypothetical protein
MIHAIKVQNDGYIICKSSFYKARDTLSGKPYTFTAGINKLVGEIDSGNWAVSYFLSMYKPKSNRFIVFDRLEVTVNDEVYSMDEFLKLSCYIDESYPLFSDTKVKTVREMVEQALQQNDLPHTVDEIRELFQMDNERFGRPLREVGNQIYKAMAAICFCHKKEVFCFPWLSHKRFEYYHGNLTGLLDVLSGLNKVVIVPVGESAS